MNDERVTHASRITFHIKEKQMAPEGYALATIQEYVGHELGISDWLMVDQARIDQFAACTGDQQWIHVDVERARRESPYGSTIAHGYLILALLPQFQYA